jgi:hypothetical protein
MFRIACKQAPTKGAGKWHEMDLIEYPKACSKGFFYRRSRRWPSPESSGQPGAQRRFHEHGRGWGGRYGDARGRALPRQFKDRLEE